ncbi:P-loop containing nucleoside triphosphate hydrolase protein [Neocallimastix lanati (nom. inval.)]|nr:P-loop containing nucleoside triphosphate hydrolase protein [Neocallimastix sp. JGI-2020a]
MSDSFKYNPYYDKKYRNRDNDSEDWSYNIDGTIKYNDKSNDIDKLNKDEIIQIAKNNLHNINEERNERKRKESNELKLETNDSIKKYKHSHSHSRNQSRDHDKDHFRESSHRHHSYSENKDYEKKYIWSRSVDEVFFSKKGQSKILIGTEEYYDFKDFYKKYNELRLKKLKSENKLQHFNSRDEREKDEHKNIKIALNLFADFKEKKLKNIKEKIKKVRDSLPIKAYEEEIVDAVKKNKVILIAGDTGCGKSTQVVQYLLESGYNKIACTQPRRIACSSLARRVTYETQNIYGSEIAYQVRFDSSTKSSRTKVLFLTEQVIRRREDIRLILMSATINIELFSNYFNAPTIKVPGKVYPVRVEYMPIAEEDRIFSGDKLKELRENNKIMSIPAKPVKLKPDQSIPSNERGDLLIFQSGINEISKLAEELKLYANYTKKWIILQLHSTLSAEEQDKVFAVAPEGVRKCIISTNIAETSVTIDGIRFIIDSGKVKEMGYDIECGVSKLSEYWISKASAMQRMGRAGRTGPGECFRFYSENEFENLNDFAIPEIKRIPLESIILQICAFNLGNPRDFDFIEKPPIENIIHSINHLKNINALDHLERLTPLGKMLSNMPIDVSLGKMLIMAMFMGFSDELIDPVITIISGLSIQSPFLRVNESQTDILKNKHKFDSDDGDTFTLLNLYSEWLNVKAKRNESSKMWCRRHGVEEQRLYEMVKLKNQFQDILEDCLNLLENGEITEGDEERFKKNGVTLSNMREYYDKHRHRNDHHRHNQSRRDSKLSYEERREKKEYREYLKRQKVIQRSQKKRIVLKLEEESDNEEQEEPNTLSLHEIEFELNNDASLLQENSDISNLTSSDKNLLKIIMCCGLYPNLAIADSANPMRKDNEQNFHTKNKSFIYMHPSSIYYSKPELLHSRYDDDRMKNEKGEEKDNEEEKEPRPETLYSLRNEMQLLFKKDSKPSSFEIDKDLDEPLEDLNDYTLPAFVKKIRKDWEEIQYNKNLRDDEQSSIEADDVTRLLIEFMNMKVDCRVTKPSSNELSAMFPFINEEVNDKEGGKHEGKNKKNTLPGLPITPYIRYGSLPLNAKIVKPSKGKNGKNKEKSATVHLFQERKFYSPPDPYIKQYWKCGWCNKYDGVLERAEAIEHLNHCSYYQENLVYIQQLKKKKKKNLSSSSSASAAAAATTTAMITDTKEMEKEDTNEQDSSPSTITKKKDELSSSKEISSTSTAASTNANTTTATSKEKIYFCKNCNEEIIIHTPADILRHRKSCTSSTNIS